MSLVNSEIGSEFWLSDIPTKYVENRPRWISSWGNNVLTSSGRGAISLMLKQVEDKIISKTVLLPAYTCESVIEPFVREGYNCYFYDVDEKLNSNIKSIDSFDVEKIGIFLHMGFYGFPTNNNLRDTVKIFKNKKIIIIEDVTHTLFSKYKRFEENDYYVASLRKWLGIPSGGLLTSEKAEIQNKLDAQYEFSNIRKEALLLKGEFIKTNNKELKQKFLDMFMEAESILDEDSSPYAIDNASIEILNRIDIDELVEKRKKNFLFLLNNLKESKLIKLVFKDLPRDICPMFFPIYLSSERNKFRRKLIIKDIYCPIHWPAPYCINLNNLPKSRRIYKTIMSIPCDQRYDLGDMERIVTTIKDFDFTCI